MGSLSNYWHTNLFCLESFNKICDLTHTDLYYHKSERGRRECSRNVRLPPYEYRSGRLDSLRRKPLYLFIYESSFLQYFGRGIQSSCQRQLVCRVFCIVVPIFNTPHGVIRLNHNRFQQVFCNQDFAIYKILTP